jgi:hypothetical protein
MILHTSKPLSRPVKASFNPLFADRILSTTVPIKVRCSSEMDALCNVPIRTSGASGFLEVAAGVRAPLKGVRLLDPRMIFGCKPDRSGPSLLVPVGPRAACWSGEILRDDTSESSTLRGEDACGGVSLSIISGSKSPDEEDCWGSERAGLQNI